MKISDAKHIFNAAMKANQKPVLMTGLHGIGKSKIVEQWCKENDYHFEVLFLSQVDVGDIIGIPFKEQQSDGRTVTYHAEPAIFDRMHTAASQGKQCVLFLDELSRGAKDVQQSCFQLILNGAIHEIQLPVVNGKKTLIIAADNPTDAGYDVSDLDPALLNRLLKLNVEMDVEDWLKYAKSKGLNKSVTGYIAQNPTKLHFMPEDETDASATPRSWEDLSLFVDNFANTSKEFWYSISAGLVGKAIGAEFVSYFENYKDTIKVEDIVELAETVYTQSGDIHQAGDAVKKLTKNIEGIQKMDIVNQLLETIKPESTKDDVVGLFGMLYSLELEILASIFKEQQNGDITRFIKFNKLDMEFHNGVKNIVKLIRTNAGNEIK